MHQTLLAIRHGHQQTIHTEPLPDGTAGNLRTLEVVRQWVREDAAFNFNVRQLARQLVSLCSPGDFDCEVEAIFEYAQSLRFVRDPLDVERIADAETTIAEQQGDCVDKSIVLASLLGSIGHVTRGKVVNFAGDVESRGFDHFYLEVQRPDGSWQPLDPTPENAPIGWEAWGQERRLFEFWDSGSENMGGLLDDLLPGLVQQGFQIGTQWAAAQQRQSQISSAQSRQIGQSFDNLARNVTALFDDIQHRSLITVADLSTAAAAYQQLADMAQQYAGVQYVTEQWNSPAYRPAYEARLRDMAARVPLPPTNQTPVQSNDGQPSATTVPPALLSITNHPLFVPGMLLAAVLVLPGLLSRE